MVGRPKGSKNRRTILKEQASAAVLASDPEFDPYLYIMSVGKNPALYDEKKAWAASELMPYKYPKLSSAKIDADVTNHPTKEQASEAAELVKEQIKANGHTNGTNGAAVVVNGADDAAT